MPANILGGAYSIFCTSANIFMRRLFGTDPDRNRALEKPPAAELIPCRRKPLRRTRPLRDPAQTQVWSKQVWLNTTFISQGSRSWDKKAFKTIWARQNLQLLTSSKSGWRALVQILVDVLILRHVDLKWSEGSGRSAFMGGVSPVLCRLVVPARPIKISAGVQFSAPAQIFTISWEKSKILSRLLSVLSLPQKFVHDHCCCPNSAIILTDS